MPGLPLRHRGDPAPGTGSGRLVRLVRAWSCRLALTVSALPCGLAAAEPAPPRMLLQGSGESLAFLRLPGGSFAFYNRLRPEATPFTLRDRAGVPVSLLPSLPADLAGSPVIRESRALENTQVILTPDRRLISIQVRGESLDPATVKLVGLPRYLDLWMTSATPALAAPSRRIWRGYNGSQMEYQQLPDGRLLVPFGSMQPHARAAPPTGRHATVVLYSDDAGQTWQESPARLISPCYDGFNGSNEGACEPSLEALADGRLWMLLRTQAGFLYETFSVDRGQTWTAATASRFSTSTGPSNLLRLPNGWLLLAWNNCELPLRHAGQGVYGGRDALHVAVTADEGRTWRGFREVYLDHRRNDNPARSGDRGTAYPLGAYTKEGSIVILAGQGQGGRNPILIDPDWIVARTARTDFSDGLEQWSVYKHHGPAKGWWRARAVGGLLVPDPSQPAARCLQLRRVDDLPADVGVWNFPNAWKGSLTARVRLPRGTAGGLVCLNDRFFDPSESLGQDLAQFRLPINADGRVGTVTLAPEQWHELTLTWDLTAGTCALAVDGQPAGSVPLGYETLNGLSYVRFASTATARDPAGLLVGAVRVEATDPFAPARTAAELRAHEQRYVARVVPRWRPPP
ncbi:MAG: exo-alpha-sialidase [Verrucomicrobia bacterium]|nr:exo-alpha-sialidase [Verrucomicrobiota bacterium]